MNPQKKLHVEFPKQSIPKSNPSNPDDEDDDMDFINGDDSFDESPKKTRKRRTLGETGKREFVCGCGKSYVSYPAIYLHVQRKHSGDWPKDTIIPEKPENQDKVKRGRPKKEKDNTLDIYKNFHDEVKYNVEDEFWVYLGMKGNADNQKAENKFIKYLEASSFEPLDIFKPQQVFTDATIYQKIYNVMEVFSNQKAQPDQNESDNADTKDNKKHSLYDLRLGNFILWISNPLREEIFNEIGTILCLLRSIMLCSIWSSIQKDFITLNGTSLEIKAKPTAISLQMTAEDCNLWNNLQDNGLCAFIGHKWAELKKITGGVLLSQIVADVEKNKPCENQFFVKLSALDTKNEELFESLAKSILFLKETEVKEESILKKRSFYLNWHAVDDLKELLQKLCAWLQHFNEQDLKLKQIDWSVKAEGQSERE